jgi:hypothetical protein
MGTWTPGSSPSSGPDTFFGDMTNETADGLDGADTLFGGAGNDTLQGGRGADILEGGNGNDILYGLRPTLTPNFEDGLNDTDVLRGGGGDDILIGGPASDTLEGGDGNDTLVAEYGLIGANGVETTSDLGNSGVTMDGGAGNDRAIYDITDASGPNSGPGSPVRFDANVVTSSVSLGNNFSFVTAGGMIRGIFRGIEDFTLYGNAASDEMIGAGGADAFYGRNGDDTLRGGGGNDTLDGGVGSDVLDGGAGNDTLIATSGNDRVTGGAGADRFILDLQNRSVTTITDFNRTEGDTLDLSDSFFPTGSPRVPSVNALLQLATNYSGGVEIAFDLESTHIWRLEGVTRESLKFANITFNDAPLSRNVAGDVNGDNRADITWTRSQGTTTQSVETWLMDRELILSTTPSQGFTGFAALNTGHDFTVDGRSDVLYRSSTGFVGMQFAGLSFLAVLPAIDLGWRFQGVGDFNGDAKNDIVWRHQNGDVSVWLMMNALSVSDSVAMPKVDNNWKIQGVGDFNGDGNSDVLWRHLSGQVVFWQMDGTRIADNRAITNIGLEWSVAGIGDFNGDGKSDVAWRHDNGFVSLWTMDGYNIATNTAIADVNNSWRLEAIADYSGDGRSDLLWRNGDFVAMWEMDGSVIAGNFGVGARDPSWSILGGSTTSGDII